MKKYYVEVNVRRYDAAHQCNLTISYACSVANRGGKAHNAPIIAAACAAGDMLAHAVNAGDLLYVVQRCTRSDVCSASLQSTIYCSMC